MTITSFKLHENMKNTFVQNCQISANEDFSKHGNWNFELSCVNYKTSFASTPFAEFLPKNEISPRKTLHSFDADNSRYMLNA